MKKILTLLLVLVFAFAMCGFSTDFTVSGSLVSEGEEVEELSNSYAVITVSTETTPMIFSVNVYLDGVESPLRAVFTADKTALGFSFPDFDENYYTVNWEVFKDAAEDVVPVDLDNISAENIPVDDLMEIFERYFGIIMELQTEENTTVEEGAFSLPGLGAEPEAQKITVCPTQADWESFITTMASTLQGDGQLRPLIEKGLSAAYASGMVENASEYASAEEYVASGMAQFDELLTSMQQDPASYAEAVAGLTLEAGHSVDSFYGARVMKDGNGVGYEGYTFKAEAEDESDTRCDGIFLYSEGEPGAILCNELNLTESGFSTYAYTDMADITFQAYMDMNDVNVLRVPTVEAIFSAEGMELSCGSVNEDGVAIFYADLLPDENNEIYIQVESDGTGSEVSIPAGESVAITSVDELMNVLSTIFAALDA